VDCNLEVTFKNTPDMKSIRKHLEHEVNRLDKKFEGITTCKVSVDLPRQHRYPGNVYNFEIEVETPSHKEKVTRSPSIDGANSNTFAMIRDAFHEMEFKLKSYLHTRTTRPFAGQGNTWEEISKMESEIPGFVGHNESFEDAPTYIDPTGF